MLAISFGIQSQACLRHPLHIRSVQVMQCLGALGLPPRTSNQGTHNEATVKVHVLACGEPRKELYDHNPAVLLENGYSYACL